MTQAQTAPCPRCRVQIASSSAWCPNCGLQLASPPPAEPSPPAEAPPPYKPPPAKGSPIAGLLVLAGLGALIWFFFIRDSSPAGTSPTQRPGSQATAPPVTAAFAPINLSGTGNKVAKFTIPADATGIAKFTHRGTRNFIVTSKSEAGADTDLLVNTIGAYTGTVLFDASAGEHSAAFEIEADGAWTAVLSPVASARSWSGSGQLSATGDDVIRVSPNISGLFTVDLSYSGDGNFIVTSYGRSGSDLVANEIDQFSGESTLADGTYLLTVEAEGAWSITPN